MTIQVQVANSDSVFEGRPTNWFIREFRVKAAPKLHGWPKHAIRNALGVASVEDNIR